MSRKWLVRAVAILMAAVMALSVLYVVVSTFTAQAVTQAQIDTLKQQREVIEQRKKETQSKINSLQYEQSTVLAKKEVLDTRITLTEEEIGNINEQIITYTELIEVKKIEVVDAQKNEDDQRARFKSRVRAMEEFGTISYLAVIFEANSFSDLLSRIADVGVIMRYDEQLCEAFQQAKLATIAAKASLEEAKLGQEAEKAALEVKQNELEEQLAEAEALLAELEENIDTAKALLEEEAAEAGRIQAEINRKVEELKKQQAASVVGTGTLIWPTPSCYIVTSEYGMRRHPVAGVNRMHAGVDIGAKYGANILAADSGTVIVSEYSSSYGHYIVLNHGNGTTTLYAHMSSRLKKVGDKVSQSDVIGKVGSTGVSTGPHLHFEVSVNGSRVNPLNYYSGYTIR